ADELPRIDLHLPLAPALLSRPASPIQRIRPAPPERTIGHIERADARPPVHPGRRAPVRPAGPADGRDRGPAGGGPRGVLVGRAGAALRVRHETRQSAWRPGPLGPGGTADPRG